MDDALKRDAKNPDVSVSELLARTLREGAVSDETLDAPPGARHRASDENAASEMKRIRYANAAEKLRSLPPPPTRTETERKKAAPFSSPEARETEVEAPAR